ncbi:acetyl-CoA synthetase-like protein [Cryphonectria parasitica EP155]|uniref:Acetyl-CoA synthetase-like protein n=1 Tax=Cryphonectria parasitica (strain ATCC 38755 / EP155) TaxID=660469 RepID=A0A9P5CSW3_CRYP1|nr:acetyl-CoA synthetase-like protein [Cryphonectria parasitica EP155]KAF3769052.1 acetyl-CoA synthetase-like protein [Cryphonectria parasitica EP155]
MPHKSLYPSIPIPEVDIFTFLFARGPSSQPLRTAATDFGRGLKAHWRWRRGDVLAFYTPNDVDTPVLTCGVLWAGGVACPANPLYTARELAHQLTDSGARALATHADFLDRAREAAALAGLPEDKIILLGGRGDPEGKVRQWSSLRPTAYTGWYAKTKVRARRDLAFLVYSSGTTGMPKGVRLTHYNIVANMLQNGEMDGAHLRPSGGPGGTGDRMLGVLPFFHIYGLVNCVFMSIYAGWQLFIMSRFDLEKACRIIQDNSITFAYVPPPIVLALGKDPAVDRYNLTSLKMLHSGAAPLTNELLELFWGRLRLPVKQGYGLSETSPVTHVQMPDEWAKFMGSVGKLVPNMEAMIVDLEGNEVAPDEEGELWLKGPNVFGGYFKNSEKTKEAFSPDGWFKTGDIFKVDKHGNYYCVDRLKELIKYKGFQVPPAELEGLLLGHHDVADVCVIGVYDNNQATELPRAYVVLNSGVQASDDKAREIAEWMAPKVSPHKRLRGGVFFIDAVPKSPSGKILRRIMRDRAKQEERKAGPRL